MTEQADLANFDTTAASEMGAPMEVRSPKTGETFRHSDGRPFTITVVGRDSERFLKLMRAQSDRRLQSALRTRAPLLTGTVEKDEIELLVNATLDWDLIMDGQRPEPTPQNIREAYSKYRWLREQVDEFCGNRANFLKD